MPIASNNFSQFQSFSGGNVEAINEIINSIVLDDRYTLKEKKIISQIANSYKKYDSDDKLTDEDFILSEHEISELSVLDHSEYIRYLHYRYSYNKYPQLHIIEDYPPCIQIEVSSVCNYRCTMCFQVDKSFSHKKHGHMGMMSFDLYKKIIDEIDGKVEAVTLASRGEPTLNKDFIRMMEYSAGKFLGFKINTNASCLTENKCHAILSNIEYGTIVFSLETINPKKYKEIRVNGCFEDVEKNIKRFKEIKEREYPNSKIITRISGVDTQFTDSISEVKSYWKEYVDQFSFVPCNPWVDFYQAKEINDIEIPCSDLWRRMFVWWDGSINPCDYDYKSLLSVGNIKNGSISESWTSKEYEKLRLSHLEKERSKVVPCKQCPSV